MIKIDQMIKRRVKLGLNKARLARYMGVNRSSLSRLERGIVKVTTARWENWNSTLLELEGASDDKAAKSKEGDDTKEEREAQAN